MAMKANITILGREEKPLFHRNGDGRTMPCGPMLSSGAMLHRISAQYFAARDPIHHAATNKERGTQPCN